MTQNITPSVVGLREKLYLLASGCLLGSLGLLFGALSMGLNVSTLVLPQRQAERRTICQEIVQPKATLSREQLSKLLSVPERSPRRKVQEILKEPYCRLPTLIVRAGAKTERDIYPLAFEPQTSLIIIYEGEIYVGYGFKRS